MPTLGKSLILALQWETPVGDPPWLGLWNTLLCLFLFPHWNSEGELIPNLSHGDAAASFSNRGAARGPRGTRLPAANLYKDRALTCTRPFPLIGTCKGSLARMQTNLNALSLWRSAEEQIKIGNQIGSGVSSDVEGSLGMFQ